MCGVWSEFEHRHCISIPLRQTHASATTYSVHTHIKNIPLLDVYLHNCSDVCVTVLSFQKHRNNKEGKVCHLVHQLYCNLFI